ncbi:sensor histidine kinase [Anaerocolumna sp. MB42-C2]|uniref:sensor histidine kinase n=1 Tax=Anaerocolumna sp. MB42-C2 TaxID=3070997 RepID=UPI0027E0840C|nr:histidine kinase [Anaerocolumna sp. MB42-C2]WMJ89558.1 histidine kinase [Anaerocolumna sp. MB42-C2]
MKKLKSQILLWMIILIVPLLLVLAAYNLYTLKVLNKQVSLNNSDIISIYEKPVVQDMDYISYSMANSMANNSSMLQLNYATSYMEAYFCCNDIASDFKAMVRSELEGLGALGISSPQNNLTRMVYSDTGKYTYDEKCELNQYIALLMQDEECYRAGWQLLSLTARDYLVRILKNNNVYIIMVIDFSLITTPQKEADEVESGYLVYTDEDNIPLIMKDFITENDIVLKQSYANYYISGGDVNHYMIVQKEFPYAGIRQYYISPYNGAFRYLDVVQILLMIITISIACFIPVGFYYMKKTLFNPMESMITTMESIGAGQTDAHMDEDYKIAEFLQVKDTFNAMVDKIKALKINAYEQELQYKNVQMQYLQIQIRPHFFLNCLKNIYAMANQKQYDSIQEMILLLSQYLRSLFKINPSLISIEEEMKGVNNYIALQQMCRSEPPECNIDVDSDLWQFQIPTLSIITFIENSVKHGGVSDKRLMISIRVSKLISESESYVCITILDNGPGFSSDGLNISDEPYDVDSKEHIGIINIKKRIELLYHGKGTILFGNSNGACVEIYIPMDLDEVKKDDSISGR